MKANRFVSKNIVFFDIQHLLPADRELPYQENKKKIEEKFNTEVRKILKEVKKHVSNLDERFDVSIWNVKQNIPKFIYVFFFDTRAANVILGLNVDGSERVEYIEVREEKVPALAVNFFDPYVSLLNGKSWADIAEEEDALQAEKVTVRLEPLIKVDPKFNVTAAWVNDVSASGLCYNKLTVKLPDGVTDEMLLKIFKPYATTGTEFYPKVSKYGPNSKPLTLITFDPGTHDAQFAEVMRKYHTFRIGSEERHVVFQMYKISQR